MIKFYTNEEIITIYRKLTDFYGKNIELPIKFLYYLQRNVVEIESIYKSIMNTLRGLETKYAENPEDEKYKEELVECLNIQNDIHIKTCKIEELGDVILSWQDLQAIDFMIE